MDRWDEWIDRFLIRSKLYHLLFWVVYHYVWWTVALGSPGQVLAALSQPPYALKFSGYVLIQAGAVYLNLYILMPVYLDRGRFKHYLTYLLLTIFVATLCIVAGYYASSYISGRSLSDLYGTDTATAGFSRFLSFALPSTVSSMTLAMSIKLTRNWMQTRQRQQPEEQENPTAMTTSRDSASQPTDADHFFVKCGSRYEKLFFDDILFVEGLQNYVVIVTTRDRHVTLLSLTSLVENLTNRGFMRVHKSYAVATSKVNGIEGHELFIQDHRVPISRQYRDEVMQTLLADRVWKK